MSDHIAHLGICDDVFRLARVHDEIEPTFKTLMDDEREAAHMGCITRHADKWSADMIAKCRDALANDGDPLAPKKLAFILGSLTHRSADRHTKPITKCWKGVDASGYGSEANESKIMQDIFVFREVYGQGFGEHAGPFPHEVMHVPTTEAETHFEAYMRILLRRSLIAMHTFKADDDHIDDWFNAFFDGLQAFPKSMNQYAELNASWDPAKVKKYLTDKHFYDRNDPMIQLARAIQHGSTVRSEQIVEAMTRTTKANSRYARTLTRSLEYLLAAGRLFRNEIGVDEAKTAFDVGVPELSLQE